MDGFGLDGNVVLKSRDLFWCLEVTCSVWVLARRALFRSSRVSGAVFCGTEFDRRAYAFSVRSTGTDFDRRSKTKKNEEPAQALAPHWMET